MNGRPDDLLVRPTDDLLTLVSLTLGVTRNTFAWGMAPSHGSPRPGIAIAAHRGGRGPRYRAAALFTSRGLPRPAPRWTAPAATIFLSALESYCSSQHGGSLRAGLRHVVDFCLPPAVYGGSHSSTLANESLQHIVGKRWYMYV